ncbi:bifunctional protein GlmU-like [Ptychodera flava]|uniref:bifunctional protein GlmU-like n=1 Tax=Ptychodera flava TaxID=63121 RepID=UPI00396A0B62
MPKRKSSEVDSAETILVKKGEDDDSKGERKSDEKEDSPTSSKTTDSIRSHVAMPSPMVCYAIRLGPGEEIHSTLMKFVKDNDLDAAFVMTCVGSITKGTIRLANADRNHQNEIISLNERFEIVSLVGSLSDGGHLHICLSDKDGKCVGGHVVGGLEVFTTAEIVIGQLSSVVFKRQFDDRTGFDELVVKPRNG